MAQPSNNKIFCMSRFMPSAGVRGWGGGWELRTKDFTDQHRPAINVIGFVNHDISLPLNVP